MSFAWKPVLLSVWRALARALSLCNGSCFIWAFTTLYSYSLALALVHSPSLALCLAFGWLSSQGRVVDYLRFACSWRSRSGKHSDRGIVNALPAQLNQCSSSPRRVRLSTSIQHRLCLTTVWPTVSHDLKERKPCDNNLKRAAKRATGLSRTIFKRNTHNLNTKFTHTSKPKRNIIFIFKKKNKIRNIQKLWIG